MPSRIEQTGGCGLQILGSLSDIIEGYEFENQVIRKIADRERSELASKMDLNEESS